MKHLLTTALCTCLLILLIAPSARAQSDESKVENATSAAPASISDEATVLDWPAEPGGEMPVLREGTNAWTCVPDMPDTPGNDPACLDDTWLAFFDAYMNKEEFETTDLGFGYMLQGGAPQSNKDPYAEEPTPENEWLSDPVPHLMIIVPNDDALESMPETPEGGGPWVMWRDTPYAHIMAPLPEYHMSDM